MSFRLNVVIDRFVVETIFSLAGRTSLLESPAGKILAQLAPSLVETRMSTIRSAPVGSMRTLMPTSSISTYSLAATSIRPSVRPTSAPTAISSFSST